MRFGWIRYVNKTYVVIGPFEIQYGHLAGSLGFWFHGHWHCLWKGRDMSEEGEA